MLIRSSSATAFTFRHRLWQRPKKALAYYKNNARLIYTLIELAFLVAKCSPGYPSEPLNDTPMKICFCAFWALDSCAYLVELKSCATRSLPLRASSGYQPSIKYLYLIWSKKKYIISEWLFWHHLILDEENTHNTRAACECARAYVCCRSASVRSQHPWAWP